MKIIVEFWVWYCNRVSNEDYVLTSLSWKPRDLRHDGYGFRGWLNNKWTSNDGAVWRWIAAVMWVWYLDVGMTMQLTCPWRPWDHLARQGNVLERRILGGAIIQWLALCAVHDGAHVALRRRPLWSSFRSDIRRLRVRVTYQAADWTRALDLVLALCKSLVRHYTPCMPILLLSAKCI